MPTTFLDLALTSIAVAHRSLFRARFRIFLFLVLVMCLASRAPAAQQVFWPFNQFPPATWRFASTNADSIAFSVPGVGTVLSRNFVLTNLTPNVLPGFGNSVTITMSSVRLNSEVSVDGGANWFPYTGTGSASLLVANTSPSASNRTFSIEMTALNIPVNGAPGAALVRESPSLQSVGQAIVTATNGGFLMSSFINMNFEITVDNGANWAPGQPAAYLEISGPAGTPTKLSVSIVNSTNALLCWNTQPNGQYQLQKKNPVDGANWANVGASLPGNGSTVCVSDIINRQTNQFYRVQLSP